MEILNLTDFLKEKFNGIKVYGDGINGASEGMTTSILGKLFICRLVFRNIETKVIDITYGEMMPSSIPNDIIKRVWTLANCTDLPEKKKVALTLNYSETVSATKSTTITEGKSTTIKADGGFIIGVAKASVGLSETITLNLQKSSTNTVSKTNSKSETFEIGDEVPANTAMVVSLIKNLKKNEIPFIGKLLIDGDVGVSVFFAENENIPATQGENFAYCGKISKYLSDVDRIIEAKGSITDIISEATKKITKHYSTIDRPELCNENLIDVEKLPINGFLNPSIQILSEKISANNIANIQVININSFENGQYDIDFNVETIGCEHSACSGFDVTFVLENNGETFYETQNIAGWADGDSNSENFLISRSGSTNGILTDVINIQSPEFDCYQ